MSHSLKIIDEDGSTDRDSSDHELVTRHADARPGSTAHRRDDVEPAQGSPRGHTQALAGKGVTPMS
ncbi:hypothetical protein RCH23_003287 [Cryobacterium sp. CAN_C3]|uniref:hypothetical protein n=1 Tax=unclassified Cryobacterium TaxID=2649013 RepID=UPI0018CBCC8D|nr:hypothetical protein [Cryobacterium sp. CAN_C3]MEC5155886.1 hypothetical protein [Cryobacterium sp. CAN_C3]